MWNCPAADAPLTAHHQQQHDQQRGHEHQQGQPDVVPHLGDRTAVGAELRSGGRGRAEGACWASAAGAGGDGAPARQGRRAPLGSAPRGRSGAGRRGGGHRGRLSRPTLRSPARGARGKARRRAPLTPHRSGEPGTRRPETPATAGCASMADAARPWTGLRASTGTRGGHTALVAVRLGGWGWEVSGGGGAFPRPAGTAANVS